MSLDWDNLRQRAEQQGWRVSRTGKGHYRWLAPDRKHIVVTGSTVSDVRGIRNTLARLRRAGFNG